jgi:hypothetical protein
LTTCNKPSNSHRSCNVQRRGLIMSHTLHTSLCLRYLHTASSNALVVAVLTYVPAAHRGLCPCCSTTSKLQ